MANKTVDWGKCAKIIPSTSGYGVDDICVPPPAREAVHKSDAVKGLQAVRHAPSDNNMAIPVSYKPEQAPKLSK